jgi:hypothetical protein
LLHLVTSPTTEHIAPILPFHNKRHIISAPPHTHTLTTTILSSHRLKGKKATVGRSH